jgi:hypothetical protein
MFDLTLLKKRIIESYEKNNLLADKINLEKSCRYVENPVMEKFASEVLKHKTTLFNEKVISEEVVEEAETAELEEVVKAEDEDEVSVDISILEKIDHKVLTILHYLNLNYYKKHELKNLIVNDMLDSMQLMGINQQLIERIEKTIPDRLSKERFLYEVNAINDADLKLFFIRCYPYDKYDIRFRTLSPSVTSADRLKIWCILNKITWYIEKHIDYEFKENERRRIQFKRDLLLEVVSKLKPELEKKLISHEEKRVKNINQSQIDRYLNYLIEYFDTHFIKVDKFDKKLNNEDNLFLLQQVKQFIQNSYRKKFKIQD